MSHQVLALDSAGSPNRWMLLKDAIQAHVHGTVAWSIGEPVFSMRGGINRASGRQSIVETAAIISITGYDFRVRHFNRVPGLEAAKLFQRDRHTCAYCGGRFQAKNLEMEHIYPKSRGGPLSWMNLVSACNPCNGRKKNRTPDEAGMPLLYAPYVPNNFENFIMSSRNILADQMDFLIAGVPKHSRLL